MKITTGQMNSERCDTVIVWNACNRWSCERSQFRKKDKSKIQHTKVCTHVRLISHMNKIISFYISFFKAVMQRFILGNAIR